MSHEKSSRKSQRTIPYRVKLALLGGSVFVFAAGSVCLSWAVEDARQYGARAAPVAVGQMMEAKGQGAGEQDAPTEQGTMGQPAQNPGSADSGAGGGAADTAGQLAGSAELPGEDTDTDAKHAEKPSPAGADEEARTGTSRAAEEQQAEGEQRQAEKGDQKERKQNQRHRATSARNSGKRDRGEHLARRAATASGEHGRGNNSEGGQGHQAQKQEEPQREKPRKHKTRKKRHTEQAERFAYQRMPVYRTVQHKAVRITEHKGSEITVRRGSCPVCGKVHSGDYSERVFDHYKTVKVPAG